MGNKGSCLGNNSYRLISIEIGILQLLKEKTSTRASSSHTEEGEVKNFHLFFPQYLFFVLSVNEFKANAIARSSIIFAKTIKSKDICKLHFKLLSFEVLVPLKRMD